MQNQFISLGSANWDILGRAPNDMALYDDVGGRVRRMIGGVAGPIAMKLAALGAEVELMSYAGTDTLGDALVAKLSEYNVRTTYTARNTLPTDVYLGIEAPNGLIAAIADCHSLEAVSADLFATLRTLTIDTKSLIIDGNVHEDTLEKMAEYDFDAKALWLVPASPGKIKRFLPFLKKGGARITVNLREANALCGEDHTDAPTAARDLVAKGIIAALVSNGEKEAAYADGNAVTTALPPQIEVKRFTGAGDTLSAHFIHAITKGDSAQSALEYALDQTATFISREDLDA